MSIILTANAEIYICPGLADSCGHMIDFSRFELLALERRALNTEEREAIEILYESDIVGITVVARQSEHTIEFFIEISLRQGPRHQAIDIDLLKRQYELVFSLHSLGYHTFHDGNDIIAESKTSLVDIQQDLDRVRIALDRGRL